MISSELSSYITALAAYMVQAKFVEAPLPKVRLVQREQTDSPLYAKTGHYDPTENEIVLYVAGRHPKDILRTFAHELIHVHQDHENRLTGFDGEESLKDDPKLRELEGEAFLKGNLALRDWTEQYTKS